MDYKKTNAPSSTVTRDMMELCADTGNVYETVSIIGKRANQISVEIKVIFPRSCQNLLPIMTIWKRYSKIGSRLKFHAIMRNCRSRH